MRDVDQLRSRIRGDDEEIWYRLLMQASEYLAWSTDNELRERAQQYRREVEAAEHLHRRLDFLLDRMDMAFEIASVWRARQRDHKVSDDLANLVCQSRLEEFPRVRPRLGLGCKEDAQRRRCRCSKRSAAWPGNRAWL